MFYIGNNAKTLRNAVEHSLKKLRTTYIDLLYVHWWDWETSIEEVMRALNILVQQGKVIYLVSGRLTLEGNFELKPLFVGHLRHPSLDRFQG